MKKPAVIHTDSFFSVTFIDGGRSFVVLSHDERFEKCLELFNREDYEGLRSFLNPDYRVEKFSNGDFKIDIEENSITYKGEDVHNVIAGRVFDCIEGKMPYNHLLSFLNNVLECDSFTVLNELYLFLESNESMLITDDGAFLAYRVVDSNYMSKHPNPDGTHNRNMIGDKLEMPRNQVNPDRNQTCERGLHFCSYNYINFYGWSKEDHVMIVKIFPQDVIAIPNDYNNAKGRCCRYEVVGEVEGYDGVSDEFKSRAERSIEDCAHMYSDVYDDFDDLYGNEENEYAESVDQDDLMEYEKRVKRILENQTAGGQSTTARRVSKSIRPHISCEKVLDIAENLGYSFTECNTLSQTKVHK